MSKKDFFSIKEFASEIQVHPNTVRRAVKAGKIASINIGTGAHKAVHRIPYSEITRLMKFDVEEMIKHMEERRKRLD